MRIEPPGIVAHCIRHALPPVTPDKVVLAPDCRMKDLPRDVTFGKMQAMAAGSVPMRRAPG